MKKQDIRNAYTKAVADLLAAGYTIFPDTMGGSQGEIAHIDLTNGSEILRVLLARDRRWDHAENGYCGDTIVLTVGKAAPDTRVFDNWDGTVWNNRLEVRFQIEWADIGSYWRSHRGGEWYTTLEEGARIYRIREARFDARAGAQNRYPHGEPLGEAYKAILLRWLRKQPRMKTCQLVDIEKAERIYTCDGRRYQIRAKGRSFTLGR